MKGKKVIARAFNDYTQSSALQRLYARKAHIKNVYDHAEVAAINKTNGLVDTMIVLRANHKGNLLLAKPCEKICMKMLRDFNVKKLYYSVNGDIVCLKL